MLEVLAGFARPHAGTLRLDGQPAEAVPPHRRGLGLVLPADGPIPGLTVAATLGFALAGRDAGHGAAAVEALLQRFGLAGLGRCRGADLTPALRLRVALARALAGQPRLLLLDEPFALLDPPARASVLHELLAALEETNAAAVLATADPALALAWGGRAMLLEGGEVLQAGPVQALYDSPASARAARLLGEANCLPGRVEAIEDDIALLALDCGLRAEAAADGAVPGRAALLFVRPGRIAVAAGSAAEMGAGALPARVAALEWRGDHVRLTLTLGGEDATAAALLVTRPAGVPLAGLAPGAPAAIAWQARHATVLPPDPPP